MSPRTNTLTQGDLAQITNIFRSELQPVKDDVNALKIVTYGPPDNPDQGLISKVNAHESFKKKAGPLAGVLSLLASAAGYWVPKLFSKP